VLFPVSVRDLEIIREARRKQGGGMVKIDIRLRLLEWTGLSASRCLEPHRSASQSADRYADHARHHSQPREDPDRWPVRDRRDPRKAGGAAPGDPTGRTAGRPIRLLALVRQRAAQGRAAAGADRPNSGTDVVVTLGISEGDKVIVDGIQKARPGQVMQEIVLPPAVGG